MEKTNAEKDKKMKVNVIGVGIIGGTILEDMTKAKKDIIYGTDKNPELIAKLSKQGYDVSDYIRKGCDVYIVSVLTTEQAKEVVCNINNEDDPLIVIESTIAPGTVEWLLEKRPDLRLVVFPHRFYDKDPRYRVFNLDRVIGAVNEETLKDAVKFYSRYMDKNLIHTTDIKTAEVSKPAENTIRAIEIGIAEEFFIYLKEKGYNPEEVRKMIMTKFNMKHIMEAREGIGLHCLPKDMNMMNDFFEGNFIINAVIKTDIEYREMVKKWNKAKN
jgi:UDP-N-acetyl-D-mannosaminuronate dehydrogenase